MLLRYLLKISRVEDSYLMPLFNVTLLLCLIVAKSLFLVTLLILVLPLYSILFYTIRAVAH